MAHWSDRLRTQLKKLGWSQVELARRTGIDVVKIRKYTSGAVDQPREDVMAKLASALGVSQVWLQFGTETASPLLPVVGFVGAGEKFYPTEDAGIIEEIDLNLSKLDAMAVIIRGQSNLPVYRPGETVVCSKALGQTEQGFLNKDCVVMTRAGQGYLKRVVRGSAVGTYTLQSYNSDPILDVQIEWAAPVIFVIRQSSPLAAQA